MKWLVGDHLKGNPPEPAITWGPYLWADGLGPDGVEGGAGGRSDGLEWLCSDLNPADGVHPSKPQGAQKVARLLLDFFLKDSSAGWWLLRSPGAGFVVDRGPSAPSEATAAAAGRRDVPALQFTITPHFASDPVELRSVEIAGSGAVKPEGSIEALQLFEDRNQDGTVDDGDLRIASGAFEGGSARASLTPSPPQTLQASGPKTYLVACDIRELLARAPRSLAPIFWGLFACLFPLGWILRRRRLSLGIFAALVAAGLLLAGSGCGWGSGGSAGSGNGGGSSISFSLEAVSAVSEVTASPAAAAGTPLAGTTLSIITAR